MLFHRRGNMRIEICMANCQFSPSAFSMEMVWMWQMRIEIFVGATLNRIASNLECTETLFTWFLARAREVLHELARALDGY